MKRLLRRSVGYSLIVLALLVAALLTAPLFLDVNDYKPTIVQKLEQASGRAVEIGHIRASLFPWVGLSLADVRIGNPPGFSAEPMLAVRDVDVRVALLPLLRKQVEIKSLKLTGPQLRLERNTQGMGNWQQPAAGAPSSAPGRGAATEKRTPAVSPMWAAITAEMLRLKEGEILWLDALRGAQITLSEVNLAADQLSLERPVQLKLSALVDGGRFSVDARLGPLGSLTGIDASTLPLQAHVQADSLQIKTLMPYLPAQLVAFQGMTADLDGQFEQRPDGLRLSAGEASLHGNLVYTTHWRMEMPKPERLEVSDLRLGINGTEVVSAAGTVLQPLAQANYQLRIQSADLRREEVAAWFPALQDMYGNHPQPWRRMKLALLVSGDSKRVEMRDLQLMLDDDLVHSSGGFEFAGTPRLRLRIAAKALHLDPWLPQPSSESHGVEAPVPTPPPARIIGGGEQTVAIVPVQDAVVPPARIQAGGQPVRLDNTPAGGVVVAESNPEPDLRFLSDWRIDVNGQVEDAFWHGLDMRLVRFNLTGVKGTLVLDPLQFEVAGGQVRETASLSLRSMPARWQESVNIRGVRLGPLLAAFAASDFLDGVLDMQTELAGQGLLPDSAIAGLSGRGQVVVRDGRIKGVDIPGTLRQLNLLGQVQGAKSTDFTQLSGSFSLHKGVAHNDDLFMASPLFRLTGQGDVDLAGKTLDFHVKPRLVGTLVGQGDTAAVRKGLSVPLHILGPFASPKVSVEVDVKSLMENVDTIRDVLKGGQGEEKGKAIEQEIRKSLERLLPKF